MENLSNKLSNKEFKIFDGAGWLLGFGISIVGGLVVFVLSNNTLAAMSAAIPMGLFAGIGLEQKFQNNLGKRSLKSFKMTIGTLIFGIIVFVALFFIYKS